MPAAACSSFPPAPSRSQGASPRNMNALCFAGFELRGTQRHCRGSHFSSGGPLTFASCLSQVPLLKPLFVICLCLLCPLSWVQKVCLRCFPAGRLGLQTMGQDQHSGKQSSKGLLPLVGLRGKAAVAVIQLAIDLR